MLLISETRRFKNCILDVRNLRYADSQTLIFIDGQEITGPAGFYDDVVEYVGHKLEPRNAELRPRMRHTESPA